MYNFVQPEKKTMLKKEYLRDICEFPKYILFSEYEKMGPKHTC